MIFLNIFCFISLSYYSITILPKLEQKTFCTTDMTLFFCFDSHTTPQRLNQVVDNLHEKQHMTVVINNENFEINNY